MDLYPLLLYILLAICPVVFVTLLYIPAPYGRHAKSGWGLTIDGRVGWVLMEQPAVITIAVLYWLNKDQIAWVNIIFLLIWQFHYLYRTFIFPMRLEGVKKNFPLTIVLFAIIFNIWNGYLNGYWLFGLNPIHAISELYKPHFYIGLGVFVFGFSLHYTSDKTILGLRKNKGPGYHIPYGGGFRWVTNPNYLGEFIQWCGWAILTWSLAGAAFALFTLANLLPRAIANHKWYKEKFEDYPEERKVFFPYIF